MDSRSVEAHRVLTEARNALRRGDRNQARKFAEQAASLSPHMEDPWLILAAVASPQTSINYIKKALAVNPESARARNAMSWAMKRLQESPEAQKSSISQTQPQRPVGSVKKTNRRGPLYAVLLFALGCVVLLFAAWSASTSPVLASLLTLTSQQVTSIDHPQSWARAEIAKPTYTPAVPQLEYVDVQPTLESYGSQPVLDIPTQEPPALVPEPLIEVAPDVVQPYIDNTQAQPSTGTIYAEIIPDTPTPENASAMSSPGEAVPQVASYAGEHWIDVNLSQQRVYAYAGDSLVNSFLVSTGTWQTPTVTGKYKVWIKLRFTDMSGPGYYLPDVPYTMYFYKGYGLHGTYWHNNFGTPMSHGCVNLSIPDAEWLYNFSSVGTVVNVHY
jgi:lipoprotein-anchoring transpeptidase ErfK/SrfK